MTLLTILLCLFGISLLVTGLIYQLRSKALNSDPILIGVCYLWGGFNIAVSLA